MKKSTRRLLVAAVALLVASSWFLACKATAKPQIVYGQPACTTYVPPSWGEYVGTSEHYGMVFKDNQGTLRFVTNVPCETVPQVALQVKRVNPSDN
jgi:hypothetical protein